MEAVLGEEVLVSPAILEKLKDGEVARSPGMKYKHYAPKAQVTILRGDFAAYRQYVKEHAGPGVWALCFDGEGAQLPVPSIEYGRNHDGATQATSSVHRAAGSGPPWSTDRLCPLPRTGWNFHGPFTTA